MAGDRTKTESKNLHRISRAGRALDDCHAMSSQSTRRRLCETSLDGTFLQTSTTRRVIFIYPSFFPAPFSSRFRDVVIEYIRRRSEGIRDLHVGVTIIGGRGRRVIFATG